MDLLTGLNPEQKQAVIIQDNLLCVAGAGSGKTKALTTKIAYLLEQGALPENILAMTFTNKAAKEMKERAVKLMYLAERVNLTTFHSYSARFIRPRAHLINRTKECTIYAESDQKGVINRFKKDPSFNSLPGSGKIETRSVLSLIDRIKNKHPDRVLDIDAIREEEKLTAAQEFLIVKYEETLQSNNALDFNDLIRYTVVMMEEDPSIIPQYTHILLDEYQDTNYAQERLVRILATAKPIFTVFADADQVIYEWRGALSSIVMSFVERYSAQVVKLEDNYRSSKTIVHAANQMIVNNEKRLDKTMRATNEDDRPIFVASIAGPDQEAAFVAEQCAKQLEKEPDAQIAILYRQNRYSRKVETSLRMNNIPYRLHKGLEFTRRREIQALIKLFRWVTNPLDTAAMGAVVNHFLHGFGEKTILAMTYAVESAPSGARVFGNDFDFKITPRKQAQLFEFIQLIRCLNGLPLSRVSEFLEEDGILTQAITIKGDPKNVAEDRAQNVMELILWMNEFAKKDPTARLIDFIETSSLDISDINNSEDASDAQVHLMTVHASKGLEFDSVYIIGSVQGFFPGDDEADEESRRLFYVAMTRAKSTLVLCVPNYTYLKEGNCPSQYIEEMGAQHIRHISP